MNNFFKQKPFAIWIYGGQQPFFSLFHQKCGSVCRWCSQSFCVRVLLCGMMITYTYESDSISPGWSTSAIDWHGSGGFFANNCFLLLRSSSFAIDLRFVEMWPDTKTMKALNKVLKIPKEFHKITKEYHNARYNNRIYFFVRYEVIGLAQMSSAHSQV